MCRSGKDTLYGNAEDDILIGGTTSFDNKLDALDAIMKEWSRNDTYANRVGHLKGTIAGGLNGSYYLKADGTSRTVFDSRSRMAPVFLSLIAPNRSTGVGPPCART